MSQIRYFVHQTEGVWCVRRDAKRLGDFDGESQASETAVQHAAVDRARGHDVQMLKRDEDGRWSPLAN